MKEEVRTVQCVKLGRELPGLEKPPFKGDLGQQIYDHVSQEAWSMWKEDMQIKVLNEYRLNMANKRDYDVLMQQMALFLNLSQGKPAEVENADRGRGGKE